jgi:hypothetical protein
MRLVRHAERTEETGNIYKRLLRRPGVFKHWWKDTIKIYIHRVPKWLEQFQAAITTLEMHAEVSFSHGTKQQVFKFRSHAQSSPSSLGQWRYKKTIATPEQKTFCLLQFAHYTTAWMRVVWPRVHTSNTCRIRVLYSQSCSFISTSFCNSVEHTYGHNQLPKCVNHFGKRCIKELEFSVVNGFLPLYCNMLMDLQVTQQQWICLPAEEI